MHDRTHKEMRLFLSYGRKGINHLLLTRRLTIQILLVALPRQNGCKWNFATTTDNRTHTFFVNPFVVSKSDFFTSETKRRNLVLGSDFVFFTLQQEANTFQLLVLFPPYVNKSLAYLYESLVPSRFGRLCLLLVGSLT